MQQISDYELELMKVIWANGGTALYAEIVAALSVKGMEWTKNTIITLCNKIDMISVMSFTRKSGNGI